jgi:hypothetical protein
MVVLSERYLIFTTGDMQNKFTCPFFSYIRMKNTQRISDFAEFTDANF